MDARWPGPHPTCARPRRHPVRRAHLPVRRDRHQRRRSRGAAGQPVVVHVERHPVDPDGQHHHPHGREPARSGSPSTSAAAARPRFTAIRWSGGGTSGTHACGCAPGSQVVFSVGPFDTSPTNNYTITVWTVNSGGRESNRVNDSATPYGAHADPDRLSTAAAAARPGPPLVVEPPETGGPSTRWRLDGAVTSTFGRPAPRGAINGQEPAPTSYRARGAARAGWSGWSARVGHDVPSIPNPQRRSTTCTRAPTGATQRQRDVHVLRRVPGDQLRRARLPDEADDRRWTARAHRAGSARPRAAPLRTNRLGATGYSWVGRCLFAGGAAAPVTVG